MTIMWSACSFSNYLLNFLNKYLEGSIFVNNYYEGIAGILATAAGTTCYAMMGKKKAFTVSFSLALFGGTCIYLLESGLYVPPVSFVDSFTGSKKVRHAKAIGYLVPKVTFIAKFAMAFAFLCTYQASFSDPILFPSKVRATAIGTCQLFARGLTILAPEITELKSPKPIMCFMFVVSIALITARTFTSDSPDRKP